MTAAPDPERPRPDAGGTSAPEPADVTGSGGADPSVGPLVVLISNFPDEFSARDACTRLLEERLIACANIQAPCRSLYRWEGRTQDGSEVPVWVKTSVSRATQARLRLAALHPYDVPEILVLTTEANAAYASWVEGETLP
jgi:periplasmic divalent cation tolerance protein